MVTIYYGVVLMLSIVTIGKYMLQNPKINSQYTLAGILITINCFGRYLLATSTTLEMALFANKLLYVGSLYGQIVMFFAIEKICNFKISKIVKASMLLCSTIIMGFVLTIEKSDLYYKTVELVKGNGYNYLKKEYGPCHILNPLWTVFICLFIMGCLIYTAMNNKTISYRTMCMVSVVGTIPFLLYIVEKIVRPTVSFVIVGYIIILIVIDNIYRRITMYDITSNIIYSVERMKEFGYIIFDDKNRYVGANDYIKELYPEISTWSMDSLVPKSDSYLYKEVIAYLSNYEEGVTESKIIEAKDQYFELQCREISYRNKKGVGHMLEFINRTAETKYINAMKDYSIMLENEVTEKLQDVMRVKDMLVVGMADLLENRDNSTGGHIKRTSAVVKIFSKKLINYGEEFDVSEYYLDRVAKAAPLHDIGKIAIDDKVLRKKGRYTDEEFEKMKMHTVEGAKIIEQIMKNVEDETIYEIICNVACYHHEKWNGTGYPKGLSGEEIPLEARIMALADVFDALVSKRCYKEAFSYDEAFSIIKGSLGEHFDPRLGEIFLACREDLEELYNKYREIEI